MTTDGQQQGVPIPQVGFSGTGVSRPWTCL